MRRIQARKKIASIQSESSFVLYSKVNGSQSPCLTGRYSSILRSQPNTEHPSRATASTHVTTVPTTTGEPNPLTVATSAQPEIPSTGCPISQRPDKRERWPSHTATWRQERAGVLLSPGTNTKLFPISFQTMTCFLLLQTKTLPINNQQFHKCLLLPPKGPILISLQPIPPTYQYITRRHNRSQPKTKLNWLRPHLTSIDQNLTETNERNPRDVSRRSYNWGTRPPTSMTQFRILTRSGQSQVSHMVKVKGHTWKSSLFNLQIRQIWPQKMNIWLFSSPMISISAQ